MIVLKDVLTGDEVTALRSAVARGDFVDGTTTAGRAAKSVKANEQLESGAARDTVARVVRAALDRHPLYTAYARPKSVIRTLVSRYTPGMGYGTHTDEPVMSGKRVDLSFTLFLSDPAGYEGGELVLFGNGEPQTVKLDAGDAVLYPTQLLHRVEEVRSGERLAVVGWVRSLIGDPLRRQTLFELDIAVRTLFDTQGKTDVFDTLANFRANLTRMWVDD